MAFAPQVAAGRVVVVVAVLTRLVVVSPSTTGLPRRRSPTRTPKALVARLLATPGAYETAGAKVTNPDTVEGRRLAKMKVLVPGTPAERRPVVGAMVNEQARHGRRTEPTTVVAPAADAAYVGRAPMVR